MADDDAFIAAARMALLVQDNESVRYVLTSGLRPATDERGDAVVRNVSTLRRFATVSFALQDVPFALDVLVDVQTTRVKAATFSTSARVALKVRREGATAAALAHDLGVAARAPDDGAPPPGRSLGDGEWIFAAPSGAHFGLQLQRLLHDLHDAAPRIRAAVRAGGDARVFAEVHGAALTPVGVEVAPNVAAALAAIDAHLDLDVRCWGRTG